MDEIKKMAIQIQELEIENNLIKEKMKINKDRYIKEINELKKENIKIRENLDKILYSRSYKLTQKIKKIFIRG